MTHGMTHVPTDGAAFLCGCFLGCERTDSILEPSFIQIACSWTPNMHLKCWRQTDEKAWEAICVLLLWTPKCGVLGWQMETTVLVSAGPDFPATLMAYGGGALRSLGLSQWAWGPCCHLNGETVGHNLTHPPPLSPPSCRPFLTEAYTSAPFLTEVM